MEYEIDPVSIVSPDMGETDFAALKQSIANLGQLVAIVVAGGKIIDGRKRYRACRELGKIPAVMELPIGVDAASHAVALNLLRTWYSPSQRAMYAAAVANAPKGYGLPNARSPNLETEPIVTVSKAAKSAGVSIGAVSDAKRVRRDAVPEVVAAVERGTLTVHVAKFISEIPQEDQPAALAQALNTPKRSDGRRVGRRGVPPELRRQPKRPRAKQFEQTVSALETHLETLLELRFAVPNESAAPDWAKRLRLIRAGLGKIIPILERTVAAI